jgi:hypothetical protein
MELDLQQLEDCIAGQIEPEPFSGVVYLTKGDDVLFESGYGYAIRAKFSRVSLSASW